jgi:CheY-like chemotaxis protein
MTEPFQGASILVVDDTPENLRLLTNMLAERGYEVAVVEARALRIEVLAGQIAEYSAGAAAEIRDLVREFRYEGLASALTSPLPPSDDR